MFVINELVSLCIAIPTIVGWMRCKRMQPAYYPFLIWLSLGTVNELVSIWSINTYHTNAVNYNLFQAISPVLLTFQIYRWRRSLTTVLLCCGFLIFSVALFIVEWLFRGGLLQFFSSLIIISSTIIAVTAIFYLSHRLKDTVDYLYRDTQSLICIGITLIYTYTIVSECFIMFATRSAMEWGYYVPIVFSVVNLIANIFFIIAVLCIPLKIRFFLPRY